jgi:hypothetical protein
MSSKKAAIKIASNEAKPVKMIYSAQKEARLATERAGYL